MSIVAPTILDLMEYANDAAVQAAFVTNGGFIPQYPPGHNITYVKATSYLSDDYAPWLATNPANSLTGAQGPGTEWISAAGSSNRRFHIDLGSGKIIKRIYYENHHHVGGDLSHGVKNFTFWGSNEASAFAELTYGTDTNWTQLTTSVSLFDQHSAADAPDPKYINVTNTTSYRYYAFKFSDNWGGTNQAVRRITLQTQSILLSYSEATIKQEGSYSLKGLSGTDDLSKTLTRTVSPTINLTDKTIIKFDIRASRTGSNIKVGIHDSSGTTTEITPVIVAADTWQTVVWDISAVANANKDAIDQIIVTVVNADADNTFYIDNIFADVIQNYLIHRGRDRFRTVGYSLGN